jgi:hypothetical protein
LFGGGPTCIFYLARITARIVAIADIYRFFAIVAHLRRTLLIKHIYLKYIFNMLKLKNCIDDFLKIYIKTCGHITKNTNWVVTDVGAIGIDIVNS